MSYQAIARKYRPETFDRVVGQGHVTGTLRAALRKDKLSHAYLFSGPRGCGKTTVARLLAKAINCLTNREGDPCGECETCKAIAAGHYLDVLEIDAASNTGVDNIRELRDMAQYSPSEGSSRVFIIDEVHMLSKGAFNALLKILEEPPARVYFCFATTEANKIPRTILSRCQRFDFRLLSRDELAARLAEITAAEGLTISEGALRLLVSLAEGSVRDGLSLLDQVIAGAEQEIDEQAVVQAFGLVRSEMFLELNDAVVARDPARGLRLVEELAVGGESLDAFARGVVTNFRNLLLLRIDPELAPMVDLAPDLVERLRTQAETFSEQDLLALIERAGLHFERIHRSTQPRIMLEASVVEYCRFESRVLLSELARRLEAIGGGGVAGPSGGSARPAAGAAPRREPPRRSGPAARPAAAAEAASYAPPPQVSQPVSSAAGSDVPGWTDLINAMMKTMPRVAACLMNGLPGIDADGGRLTVAFAADKSFQVSSIRDDCPAIEKLAAQVLGRPVKVELVLGDQGQTANRREEIRRAVAPTQREELAKACQQDEALGGLVDVLGGEPLPETDRENWEGPGS
jgi:DNA polymerase-3 subunit gamma/tau